MIVMFINEYSAKLVTPDVAVQVIRTGKQQKYTTCRNFLNRYGNLNGDDNFRKGLLLFGNNEWSGVAK